MALNPQLYGNGMPVAFVGEMFVLARDGVEFQVDKIPGFVFHFPRFSGFIRLYMNSSESIDLLLFELPLSSITYEFVVYQYGGIILHFFEKFTRLIHKKIISINEIVLSARICSSKC